MAVAKNKTRIIFTCSIKQKNWLENTAKECGITTSKLIRWLIEKNIQNIQNWTTQEQLETLMKIAKTPWIIDREDDEDY